MKLSRSCSPREFAFLMLLAALGAGSICVGPFWAGPVWGGANAGGALFLHANPDVEYTTGRGDYCGDVDIADSGSAVNAVSGDRKYLIYVIAAFDPDNTPRLRGVAFGLRYPQHIRVVAHGSCADDAIPSDLDPITRLGSLGFETAGATPCPGPKVISGACCLIDGSCVTLNEEECVARNGVFEGENLPVRARAARSRWGPAAWSTAPASTETSLPARRRRTRSGWDGTPSAIPIPARCRRRPAPAAI